MFQTFLSKKYLVTATSSMVLSSSSTMIWARRNIAWQEDIFCSSNAEVLPTNSLKLHSNTFKSKGTKSRSLSPVLSGCCESKPSHDYRLWFLCPFTPPELSWAAATAPQSPSASTEQTAVKSAGLWRPLEHVSSSVG